MLHKSIKVRGINNSYDLQTMNYKLRPMTYELGPTNYDHWDRLNRSQNTLDNSGFPHVFQDLKCRPLKCKVSTLSLAIIFSQTYLSNVLPISTKQSFLPKELEVSEVSCIQLQTFPNDLDLALDLHPLFWSQLDPNLLLWPWKTRRGLYYFNILGLAPINCRLHLTNTLKPKLQISTF